ncbi:MAG TPA: glycosyltransferase family 4 protein, partial [Burkholderiales bacterium]|nr:glycosyltransferase family 4 protein [Burkholderiales bacterium]
MRIAFYAPLKSPTHGTPSGDRRVAGLLMDALAHAGHRVEVASTFRSYDGAGDASRQSALRAQGEMLATQLAEQWRAMRPADRPQLWFTYHLYYKAPDWLGPKVSEALGIPYVIAEASYAAKRAGGPWNLGHEASAAAIRKASVVFCPSRDDIPGLQSITDAQRVVHLPPFLEVAPYQSAMARRDALRAELAGQHGLDAAVPWIAVVAMMRAGDKLASYRVLADAMQRVADLPWQLIIAGDGAVRTEVEKLFERRACFLGSLGQRRIAEVLAASDLSAWPAVNEAYGMALLEAEAAGVPVISCATRGVPDVVVDGRTGLLVP